jgi:hypothetical protein
MLDYFGQVSFTKIMMHSEPSRGRRLQPLAPMLWGAEHDLFLPGGVHLRGRMTVVHLESGGLLLHSPIPIDDQLAAELAQLGTVEYLVAPNSMHHVHLTAAHERYPRAVLYGTPALVAKRSDLHFADLTTLESVPWQADLAGLHIQGAPKIDEFVFLHPATKTLVVAGYFFNIHECKGWLTPWVLRLTGTYRRFAQSRVWRWSAQDRAKLQASAEELLAWDFERIIVAHGEVVTLQAHQKAERALGWLVRTTQKALPGASRAPEPPR